MNLKPLDRTDRASARLSAALGIYRDTILPEAQNPERQILYWIEHSKESLADEFKCFALQQGKEVVGYLQYSYFREENIFFLEYFCVRPQSSSGMAPSGAVKAIRQHLVDNYPQDFTVVFEVARQRGSAGEWVRDHKLIDYFERLGFRTVGFDYRYPILQSYDGSVSYPADLMVNLPNARKTLSASDLRTVLRCIYFKHYLRWDRPFLDAQQFEERERYITSLFNAQVSRIDDKDSFDTEGNDRRSLSINILRKRPSLEPLLERVFGPKLPRVAVIILIVLALEYVLGSVWLLIPFTLVAAAVYCLAEDTDASRKLFEKIITRMTAARPRAS